MIKTILTYPDNEDILKQISKEVEDVLDPTVQQTIQDLKDTLNVSGDGVGISAIQIGIPLRICYINYAGSEYIMINPKITWTRRGTQKFSEGCLSVPGKTVMVERPQKVICTYLNEMGDECQFAEGGWASAIVQHELDHFEGKCAVYEGEE